MSNRSLTVHAQFLIVNAAVNCLCVVPTTHCAFPHCSFYRVCRTLEITVVANPRVMRRPFLLYMYVFCNNFHPLRVVKDIAVARKRKNPLRGFFFLLASCNDKPDPVHVYIREWIYTMGNHVSGMYVTAHLERFSYLHAWLRQARSCT